MVIGHDDPGSAGPLSGLRVIDLTTVLMGPLATRILGDMGADVVRVEAPGGDELRNLGPKRSEGMGWFVLNLQRNKRSVVLDLKHPDDAARFRELVATADVLVTNLRRSALERLGIGPAQLHGVNPELVYCIANGYGSAGPYGGRAAYDDTIQAVSGFADLGTWFHEAPEYVPSVLADKVAALYVVSAVLAAITRRARAGGGDVVEVPMAECLASFNLVEHLSGHTFEPPLGEAGYARLRNPHRRPRRAADGWVAILPYTDANWADFFDAAGAADLAADERFGTREGRERHADELYARLDPLIEARTVAHWIEVCDLRSIPAAPVLSVEHVAQDPHFAEVGLLTGRVHPTEGEYRWIKNPVAFGRGSGPQRHAPTLGQHQDEVLAELDAQRGGSLDRRGGRST